MRNLYNQFKFEASVMLGMSLVACTGDLTGSGRDSGVEGASGTGHGAAASLLDGEGRLTLSTDPGFKGIHRLNSREYDNTVEALLGTQLKPGEGFLNESGHGFDNIAASLGMTSSQFSAYFRAATEIAADVFSSPALASTILVCEPVGASDAACASEIIESLGTRAFRRPLLESEVETFLGVYERAVALDLTHVGAVEQVLRTFLVSAEFLYRMEFDADPSSDEPHDVSPYELASRLSYFLWSTMPDESLMSAAADGSLVDAEVLEAQVDRLLADEAQSGVLVDSLAWQWLGMRNLESHAVLSDTFPEWNEDLRAALLQEARVYLDAFVQGGQPWDQFLSAEFQYDDPLLDAHYGERGVRMGFLGLGAFLTLSSFSHRTSPTLRAKWILEELLCSPPPPPPANAMIPDLDADAQANAAAGIENVRERLELHRSDPGCANCHASMDPLGMALEEYDAIGRFRTAYDNGDAIDPTGEMPDGTAFDGLTALAHTVGEDDRFFDCTTEKSLAYALGRGISKDDESHIQEIRDRWESGETLTFHNLVRALIQSVPFRQRRGGSE